MAVTAQEVIDGLHDMAEQANKACGLSYEVYVRRVSGMVDEAISGLSAEDQAAVLAAAVERVDYATPEELAAEEAEMREEGYCSHGLTEDTCPCGCFEYDALLFEDDGPYFESNVPDIEDESPHLSPEQIIEMRAIEAKIAICRMVIAALVPLAVDCPEARYRLCETEERLSDLECDFSP